METMIRQSVRTPKVRRPITPCPFLYTIFMGNLNIPLGWRGYLIIALFVLFFGVMVYAYLFGPSTPVSEYPNEVCTPNYMGGCD